MKVFWSGFYIVIILGAAFATGTYALYNTSKSVSSSGKVSTINVSVYTDSACTQTATNVDWGTLTPGSSATYTFYIKNAGNSAETLTMSTSEWSPSTASGYITISWNRENTVLNANQVIQVTLTATVSSSIPSDITTFSNLFTITGTI